ncbi:hypothetical protein C8N43_1764 [Litoreibacter ponti]|uniref:Uncharacterized protein n=1 Tax=Litoreibacter ponti TaxID=1510457 RepID=A0A2T6BLZ8_9RHOB|nr:hypothetical protein [Litoreibacter ponti]PTX57098.1 hypothetical protein C8N43_1764 [Litoreibacter ponti]
MRKLIFLSLAAAIAAILFYLSRFWFLSLWPRSGLFGLDALPPQGGLVGRWLRGTDAAPFELLLWAIGCFLVLTWSQKFYDLVTSDPDAGDDHD